MRHHISSQHTLEGTLRGSGDLVIAGTVRGDIVLEGSVHVLAGGSVEGDVQCASLIVEGRWSGNAHLSDLFSAHEGATARGTLSTIRIEVMPGAKLQLDVDMREPAAVAATSPPRTSAPAAVAVSPPSAAPVSAPAPASPAPTTATAAPDEEEEAVEDEAAADPGAADEAARDEGPKSSRKARR
mgnify:CR=1 FL=1